MKAGEIVAQKYRLKVLLGSGGMGEVWSAIHTATDRDFAIKFMHAHVASVEMKARFAREAKASARINHPNIIDVFDVGELPDGQLYLVMEMLDGVALADALYAVPPLSVREFLSLILDAARALEAAHAVGIVHRDIKPQNVFLHRDRSSGLASAKVLDFGISKFSANEDSLATKTGSVLGSPRYMSPEQARSAAGADHRADVWALGVILFEGLTGFWPHDGDSFSSLVIAIATSPPRDINVVVPGLPAGLRSIVRDCLLPVDQRIQSCEELSARLEREIENGDLGSIQLPRPNHGPAGDSKNTTGSLRIRTPKPLTGSGSGSYPAASPLVTATGQSVTSTYAPRIDPRPAMPMNTQTTPFPSAAGIEQTGTAQWTPRGPAQQLGAFPMPTPPPSRPRDGLSESVSAMNIETVALPSPLSDNRLSVPAPMPQSPLAASAPMMSPPFAQATGGSKLGLVAAALGVLAVGIGIALFTVVRGNGKPVNASPASSVAAPTVTAPPVQTASTATVADIAPPASAPSASANPDPSPSGSASAHASKKSSSGSAPKTSTGSGSPPPKKKIENLGSGL